MSDLKNNLLYLFLKVSNFFPNCRITKRQGHIRPMETGRLLLYFDKGVQRSRREFRKKESGYCGWSFRIRKVCHYSAYCAQIQRTGLDRNTSKKSKRHPKLLFFEAI